MDIERRNFAVSLEYEDREDQQGPIIRGHAAVFDTLSENLGGFREKIAPGAFDSVLADDVRALYNHDPNHVLGRSKSGTLRLSVDDRGLHYEIDPPDTQIARDLITSLRRGDVDQSSFGFSVDKDDWKEDDDGRVIRTIIKFRRLYDVSPVTYPAYPDATVGLRSLDAWRKEHAPIDPNQLRRCRLRIAELDC